MTRLIEEWTFISKCCHAVWTIHVDLCLQIPVWKSCSNIKDHIIQIHLGFHCHPDPKADEVDH